LLSGVCVLSIACSRGSGGSEPDTEDGGRGNAGGSTATGGTAPVAGSETTSGSSSGGAGSSTGGSSGGGETSGPLLPNDTASGVFVHLFEWRWPDIALECERFLGPKGFTAVQISPPNEHAKLPAYVYPWWQRYQPVSYQIESRSGTRAEFVDMVQRCRAAGVGIYVDAVLNHMTAQVSGVGSAGTQFTKYEYPGLYTKADFHPTCTIEGDDYAFSAEHVQQCELVGLADLDTATAGVQGKLAAYLSDLLAIGVRGFRIDAAKHMAAADVQAVLAQVKPREGEKPYYFLEVIDYGGEAVHATDYLNVGGDAELDVTEFKYKGVGDAFLGRASKNLSSLKALSEQAWQLLPTDRAVAFIDNHDTQRADSDYYQDGPAHELATVFMLAWPYGYPSLMSSYAFDRAQPAQRDVGPPSTSANTTRAVYASPSAEPDCLAGPYTAASKGWVCEHRSPLVAGMVGFRKATVGAPVENVWDNGENQLAFSRGDKGFVVINHEATALSQKLTTGLPAGTYCDVLRGELSGATCSGPVVEVDAAGSAQLEVPAESALALHVAQKL
jgi:alpha-amylase